MRNKLLAKITSYVLTATILSVSICNITYASGENLPDKTILTVVQLEEAIERANADGKLTVSEKEDILNASTDEAMLAYVLSTPISNEIAQVLTTQKVETVNSVSLQSENNNIVVSNTYRINDAVDVTAEILDEAEQTVTPRFSAEGEGGGGPKDLGDRKTTGTYKVKLLGIPLISLKLTLGYTVNTTNLTARYSSPSYSVTVGSISTSTQITDSVAAQIGHDMNCIGSYDLNFAGVMGMNIGLELKVKWDHNVDADTQFIKYTLLSISE